MFQIGSNFNLGSFDGKLISFKKQLSETKAWRLGIDFSGLHTFGETLTNPDSVFVVADDDESQFTASLSYAYQHVANPRDPIRFYYGYGVKMGFFHYWNTTAYATDDYYDEVRLGPIGFVVLNGL